jgi:hypothetical protein
LLVKKKKTIKSAKKKWDLVEIIMAKTKARAVSRVMSGSVLVASIRRRGKSRDGSPVRWQVYWSMEAMQNGAQSWKTYASQYDAESAAMQWAVLWAMPRMAYAPHVVSASGRRDLFKLAAHKHKRCARQRRSGLFPKLLHLLHAALLLHGHVDAGR